MRLEAPAPSQESRQQFHQGRPSHWVQGRREGRGQQGHLIRVWQGHVRLHLRPPGPQVRTFPEQVRVNAAPLGILRFLTNTRRDPGEKGGVPAKLAHSGSTHGPGRAGPGVRRGNGTPRWVLCNRNLGLCSGSASSQGSWHPLRHSETTVGNHPQPNRGRNDTARAAGHI